MSDEIFSLDELILTDNEEVIGDEAILDDDLNDIIVYSRDWTVETVVSQIEKGNIDLNPEFQRRNAWKDGKKSSLIESYIIGYPVPEIVLAEHPRERKKFIVIDGKQRLLTLCGFLKPEKYQSWNTPYLNNLKDIKELNKKSFSDLKLELPLNKYVRQLANADVRCTIISNVKNDDVLYDIFYRLNAGATPLSTQELRQVLHSGDFTKFLINYTSKLTNIHKVLRLEKPDDRLKDIETLLRLLAFIDPIEPYTGNLKKFLDETTIVFNKNWKEFEGKALKLVAEIDDKINLLSNLLGGFEYIGRKYNLDKTKMDSRFNTVLFEVQLYFAFHSKSLDKISPETYQKEFIKLFLDPDFVTSISSSTKNIKEYSSRYKAYSIMHHALTGETIDAPWMA